ncbi:MAG TPA: hypothetical protein VKU01_20745 [Bryobacteraceae bacterium]|nr:hypothetical protein [Bryobacteraceae bacterium]
MIKRSNRQTYEFKPSLSLGIGAICVLGRGIEKVHTRSGDVWKPTRYIERPTSKGAHSGERVPGNNLNDDISLIAGAHANVLAACQLFEELKASGDTPHIVVFAAGRPAYLASDPDPSLSEGRVLADVFIRKLRGATLDTEILVLSHNRDTKDDIDECMTLALSRGISGLAVITVGLHIARASEFAKLAPQYGKGIDLRFIAAEELLLRRYATFSSLRGRLTSIANSPAYKRTLDRENRGIEALRSGGYKRSV